MKIKTRENFSNMQKGRPYTTVVDATTGIAIAEDDEIKEKTKDIFDPYERAKAKPFLGAEKQPVPDAPVEPKLTLEESYRSYANRLQDIVEDKLVESFDIARELVYFIPETKLKEFLEVRKIKPETPTLEEGWESVGVDPRPYSSQIIDMIENRLLDPEDVVISLVKWMPDSDVEKFMKIYELDDELDESVLTERTWKVQIDAGKKLRQAIDNDDYQAVIDNIKACYQEMLDKEIIDQDDFYEWTEQLDWLDLDSEDAEENIDYELSNLYDACDNLGCWIAM